MGLKSIFHTFHEDHLYLSVWKRIHEKLSQADNRFVHLKSYGFKSESLTRTDSNSKSDYRSINNKNERKRTFLMIEQSWLCSQFQWNESDRVVFVWGELVYHRDLESRRCFPVFSTHQLLKAYSVRNVLQFSSSTTSRDSHTYIRLYPHHPFSLSTVASYRRQTRAMRYVSSESRISPPSSKVGIEFVSVSGPALINPSNPFLGKSSVDMIANDSDDNTNVTHHTNERLIEISVEKRRSKALKRVSFTSATTADVIGALSRLEDIRIKDIDMSAAVALLFQTSHKKLTLSSRPYTLKAIFKSLSSATHLSDFDLGCIGYGLSAVSGSSKEEYQIVSQLTEILEQGRHSRPSPCTLVGLLKGAKSLNCKSETKKELLDALVPIFDKAVRSGIKFNQKEVASAFIGPSHSTLEATDKAALHIEKTKMILSATILTHCSKTSRQEVLNPSTISLAFRPIRLHPAVIRHLSRYSEINTKNESTGAEKIVPAHDYVKALCRLIRSFEHVQLDDNAIRDICDGLRSLTDDSSFRRNLYGLVAILLRSISDEKSLVDVDNSLMLSESTIRSLCRLLGYVDLAASQGRSLANVVVDVINHKGVAIKASDGVTVGDVCFSLRYLTNSSYFDSAHPDGINEMADKCDSNSYRKRRLMLLDTAVSIFSSNHTINLSQSSITLIFRGLRDIYPIEKDLCDRGDAKENPFELLFLSLSKIISKSKRVRLSTRELSIVARGLSTLTGNTVYQQEFLIAVFELLNYSISAEDDKFEEKLYPSDLYQIVIGIKNLNGSLPVCRDIFSLMTSVVSKRYVHVYKDIEEVWKRKTNLKVYELCGVREFIREKEAQSISQQELNFVNACRVWLS